MTTQTTVLTDEDLNECLPLGIAPHQTIVGSAEVIRLARAVEAAVIAKVARAWFEDKTRMDWLTAQNETLESDSWTVLGCDCTAEEDHRMYWVGSDLRAAIDAAMKENSNG